MKLVFIASRGKEILRAERDGIVRPLLQRLGDSFFCFCVAATLCERSNTNKYFCFDIAAAAAAVIFIVSGTLWGNNNVDGLLNMSKQSPRPSLVGARTFFVPSKDKKNNHKE